MTAKQKKVDEVKAKEVNFQCKFCNETKPINEMVVIDRFFPQLIACRDCEKKIA